MDEIKHYTKYIPLIMVIGGFYILYLMLEPFFNAIIMACLFAYVFTPLYKKLNKHLKKPALSSALTCLFVGIIILIPLISSTQLLISEARDTYASTKNLFDDGELLDLNLMDCEERTSLACSAATRAKGFVSMEDLEFYVLESVNVFTQYVAKKATNVLTGITNVLLGLFIIFFTLFYLLIDGKKFIKKIECATPIRIKSKKRLHKEFKSVFYAVLYGSIITALFQGAAGAIGFLIFGVGSALLWGIVMAIAAFIPFIGTGIIWFPIASGMILIGFVSDNFGLMGRGIGLMIYGFVLISTIDNIVKPKLIGSRAHVHPVVILLGVFGGLVVFGPLGFIIGPLFFSIFLSFFKIAFKECHF